MLQKITMPVAAFLAAAATVEAQGLEALGTRAAAMSAFVAVADDASAVAWNPAGLVTGPLFNISLDFSRLHTEPDDEPAFPAAAGRVGTNLIALGVLPLGISYYRLSTTTAEAIGPEGVGNPGRQEQQAIVRSLVTTHVGATVLQSVGEYLTVGATLKLVRGRVGGGVLPAASWDDTLDAADNFATVGSTRGDLDVGAMVAVGTLRAGALLRNVAAPTFDGRDEDGDVRLQRHGRIGVAWGDRWPGTAATIVAFDADLTRVPNASGERRDVAVGVERWWRGRRIGVRGGVRASTLADARPVGSGGVSYGVRPGVYVDGYAARGRQDERAWGVAVRLTY